MEKTAKSPGAASSQKAIRDSLFDGELVCWQHEQGYRFSIDSVILAHCVRVKKREIVLDLGTGTGVVGLILLYRNRDKDVRLLGVERQYGLYELARQNIKANDMDDKFGIFNHDIKKIGDIFKPESCDVVVFNPPYYRVGSGRKNLNQEALQARHQDAGTIEDFIKAAAFCVKNRGRVYLIYPAENLSALLVAMSKSRLEPKSLLPVFSRPLDTTGAKLVVIEAVKNGGVGLLVRSPLYIYRDAEYYSEEIEAMYRSSSAKDR